MALPDCRALGTDAEPRLKITDREDHRPGVRAAIPCRFRQAV
jgi:hypothetical protein